MKRTNGNAVKKVEAAPLVRMLHVGEEQPNPLRLPAAGTVPVAWEFKTITGGQQHLMNVLGEQGWEAYGVTQIPGVMTIWMKRRKHV